MMRARHLLLPLLLPLLLMAGCRNSGAPSDVTNTMDSASVTDEANMVPPLPEKKIPCAITGTRETPTDCAEFARNVASLKAGIDAFKPEQPMLRDQASTVRYSLIALPEEIQGEAGEIATPAEADAAANMEATVNSADDAEATGTASRVTREEIDQAVSEAKNTVAEQIVPEREAGEVATHVIKLGQRMFACLSGDPSFTIEPAACQTYNMVETPNPVWTWQVTPHKAGPGFKLFLRTGIELEGSDGKARRIGRYTKTEEIKVSVSTLGRFQDFLQSLTAWVQSPMGILAALTALLGAVAALVAAYRKLRPGKAPKDP